MGELNVCACKLIQYEGKIWELTGMTMEYDSFVSCSSGICCSSTISQSEISDAISEGTCVWSIIKCNVECSKLS